MIRHRPEVISDSEPERVENPQPRKHSDFAIASSMLKKQAVHVDKRKRAAADAELSKQPIELSDSEIDTERSARPSVAPLPSISASNAPINYFAVPKPFATSSKPPSSKPPKGKTIDRTTVPSDTIRSEFLSVATECPVCKDKWNEKKTVQAKRRHVEVCAKKQDWAINTVNVVLKAKVREMQELEEAQRRAREAGQTLFDGIVAGSGHGLKMDKLDVHVAGFDEEGAVAATQGGTLREATFTQVQKEVEQLKRKAKKIKTVPSKATKLGKAISILDRDAPMPSKTSYGGLKTYDQTMDKLAQKAEAMLAATPVVSSSPARPIISLDTDTSQELVPAQLARAPKASSALSTSKFASGASRTNRNMWALASGRGSPTAASSSSKSGLITSAKAAASSSGSDADDVGRHFEDRPDFASWDLEEMQIETARYGYKPPTTASACVKLLDRIWDALHQANGGISEDGSSCSFVSLAVSSPEAPAKSKGKAKALPVKQAAGTKRTKVSKTAKTVKKPRGSKVSMASAGEFLDESVDEGPVEEQGFSERMRAVVLQDKELYGKILRFHPVPFEAFVNLAQTHSIKATAVGIRRFLDAESITFYQEEQLAKRQAKGTRRR